MSVQEPGCQCQVHVPARHEHPQCSPHFSKEGLETALLHGYDSVYVLLVTMHLLCLLLQLVVNRAKRTVPYPLLGENTLVLSDVLCLAPNKGGQLCLTCRYAAPSCTAGPVMPKVQCPGLALHTALALDLGLELCNGHASLAWWLSCRQQLPQPASRRRVRAAACAALALLTLLAWWPSMGPALGLDEW